jgi:uncharacterized protein
MVGRPIRPRTITKASRKPATPFQCRLVVMVKVAHMGRVKTRLARQVGGTEAVRFYRHTVQAVLGRVGRDRRWHTQLSVAPDSGITNSFWPRNIDRRRQGLGDLGQRMPRIMDEAGPGPLIIIGTDIPAIRASHIAQAFTLLKSHDAVLGPTPDGGYWLVGLRRCPRIVKPFEGVRWSTAHTLDDTAANLKHLRLGTTATLSDVDDRADLRSCQSWFGRRVLPSRTIMSPNNSR